VFEHFHKLYMKILLGNLNSKLGKDNIFKPILMNECLHQGIDTRNNVVRIVNLGT
jgi:hypothetical protein